MLVSIVFSLIVLVVGRYFPSLTQSLSAQISSINFDDMLLEGMLSFLLFAGAIHIKYDDLKAEKFSIILLSTIGVVISTFLVGFATYYIGRLFGFQFNLVHALLFGALISPTDPIAVLSILKSAGVSKSLETKIAGESLFNDGVAVVVFVILLQLGKPGASFSAGDVLILFGKEAIGGIGLGLALGFMGYRLFASIDNYQVEVLLTLAIVMGGYTLAHYIHVSGPLAMVAAGLITGNKSKSKGMSDVTAEYIDKFWELIDEILNALLFVLIGLELLLIQFSTTLIILSFIMIVVTIIARFISVAIPFFAIRWKQKMEKGTLLIMTWGGLRGGISIALALSIPRDYDREIWVTITYIMVCFSILVQGLTLGKIAKKATK
jgi:CPA1 family monovalent cation:H+ antiporter